MTFVSPIIGVDVSSVPVPDVGCTWSTLSVYQRMYLRQSFLSTHQHNDELHHHHTVPVTPDIFVEVEP